MRKEYGGKLLYVYMNIGTLNFILKVVGLLP